MPEFYEVKRIKNYLKDADILNQPIKKLVIPEKGLRMFKSHNYHELEQFLVGNVITDIKTKAKYTLFIFKQGSMLMHYRFTGIPHVLGKPFTGLLYSIYSLPIADYQQDYVRFSMRFANKEQLDYVDTRCLSHIHCHFTGQQFSDYKSTDCLPDDLDSFHPLPYSQWKSAVQRLSLDLKSYLR